MRSFEPEVLVCDVIGRYDICEVLPVVASVNFTNIAANLSVYDKCTA